MTVVFFDFDSTTVQKESLDETMTLSLVAHPDKARVVSEIENITRLGMEGKLDFLESLERRVRIAPITKVLLEQTGNALLNEITPGMPAVFDWLRSAGHEPHIASGGFTECIRPVAEALGVSPENRHTNRFLFSAEGSVAGFDTRSPLWTNDGKTPLLRLLRNRYPDKRFAIIGDGMNDYRAFESGAADVFIGFGANVVREPVRRKAEHFVYSAGELLTLLPKIL